MTYQNGFEFSTELQRNIDKAIERIQKNKASAIILSGGVGEGKTTLLVQILDYVNKKMGFPEVDLETGEQLAMGGSDFVHKIRTCYEKKLPCCGYDEAGDFSKRGSLTGFNAMLNRTFDTYRAFKCLVIIALPNFDVLDQDLFDKGIPRLMLRLYGRNEKYGNFGGYSLYRMLLLKAKMKKFELKNFAYSKIHPNFRGHFLNLSKERSKQLDKYSTKCKLDVLKKSEVKMAGLLTYIDMATKLNKPVQSVRQAVCNLKIKPSRVIKKVNYFDSEALNRIEELFEYNADTRKKPRELERLSLEESGDV